MIPVDQTREHDPPRATGDCWEACLASILEVPIDDVRLPAGPQVDKTCEVLAHRFGLVVVQLDARAASNARLLDMLEDLGAYAIVGGTSPRAYHVDHAVVWNRGKIVHDPHLSRAGLVGRPKDFTYFIALNPARTERAPMSHLPFLRHAVFSAAAELIRHRHAQVCKHWAATVILDAAERAGVEVSMELAAAVVDGDDETALRWLERAP